MKGASYRHLDNNTEIIISLSCDNYEITIIFRRHPDIHNNSEIEMSECCLVE